MNLHKLISIALLIGLLASESAWAAKWGLLIEIGNYPDRRRLHAERDAYWMQNTLKQQGFPITHIRILQDKEARAQAIHQAFNDLIKQCQSGDKVVIHYGGHGTQLDDQDGDEARRNPNDKLDEALIPYDAPKEHIGPGIERYIRDDEVGQFLDQLRQKVGPNGHVLMLVDACHSGTLSRGQAVVRTDNFRASISDSTRANQKPQSGWFDLPPSSLRAAGATGTVVMISGVEESQTASEVTDNTNQLVGALCFFFSQAMASISEQETYQSLYETIAEKMNHPPSPQMPFIEGNKTARLLGGDLVLTTLFTRVKLDLQQRFRFPKGVFLGYTKGSDVTIKTTRGDDPDQSLTGRVVDATPFESIIELTKPLPVSDSISLQTTLLRQAFDAVSARVTLANVTQQQQKELEALLLNVPNIQLVPDRADWLIRPDKKSIELCRAADGFVLERIPEEAIANLPERLTAYSQANWLRELDLPNPAMNASVKLIPVRFAAENDSILTRSAVELRQGLCVLYTNQQALLTVTNTGTLPFYFSIIDIQPDASIDVPIPNNKYPAASLKLMPGKSRSFPLRRIMPPLGLETYKLLLSKTPVELRGLVQTRGKTSVPAHPLAKLLAARFRGGPQPSLALDDAAMTDFQFWIDAPKR